MTSILSFKAFSPQHRLLHRFAALLLLCLLGACSSENGKNTWKTAITGTGVEILQTENGFQLFREGKPFVIKGASGYLYWEELARQGANTARTYDSFRLDSLLDHADTLGLAVIAGMDVPKIRDGFDFSRQEATDALTDSLLQTVKQYKNHPALLCWALGNEVNLLHFDNKDYWTWTNQMVQAIHAADPAHPVIVSVNERRRNYELAQKLAPSIDILGVNVFANMEQMIGDLDAEDTWRGPLLVTEWSPIGYWEAERTQWNAPVESSDLKKAALYEWYYQTYLSEQNPRLLGSLVFYWGQKLERTDTWFSLFSIESEKTAVVDAMGKVWGAPQPDNHAPTVGALFFDGPEVARDVFLPAGDQVRVQAFPEDLDGDEIVLTWEILPEGDYMYITGGDAETRPEPVETEIATEGNFASFQVPEKTGAYRIFAYARDAKGGFGYHNLPFYVVNK